MLLKDPNTNDTRLSDESIAGRVEITQEESEGIYELRMVQPAQATAEEVLKTRAEARTLLSS